MPASWQDYAVTMSQRTPLGCNLVSHVSAHWLTGLGFRHTSWVPGKNISWFACEMLSLIP